MLGDKHMGIEVLNFLLLNLNMDLQNNIDSLESVLIKNPLNNTSSTLIKQKITEFDYNTLVYPEKVFDFPHSAKLPLKPPRMIFIPSTETLK